MQDYAVLKAEILFFIFYSLEVVCIPKLGLQFGEVETEPLKGGTQIKAIKSWKHGLGEGLTELLQDPELFSIDNITVQ